MNRILGIVASAIMGGFSDNFDRTTSGSLGTSSSGSLWEAIKGVWYANGTQAKSDATASTYPIAAYDMKLQNVTIKLDTSNGVGTAFWVTDAQNWWGVFPFQDQVCSTYSASCNGTYNWICNGNSWVCNGWTSSCSGSTCVGWAPNYIGPGSYAPACINYSCSTWSSTCSSSYCSSSSGYCSSFTQICSGYTGGTSYLRLIKSVANTVTTVVNQAVSAAILSIKTVLSGDTITVSAYSNTGQGTQTGTDLVNTPVSPAKGTKHGLILGPSTWNQGSTADNIDIK